ncbi:MAG: collagen-like protein [Thermoplasmata archaeon]|nr:collagen-like protein [Thermoplasmata archaeon]
MADSTKPIAAIALIIAIVGLGTTLYGLTSLSNLSETAHGANGTQGANGTNGAPGHNGTNGSTGANGTQGPPGGNGSQGSPGQNGSNGTPRTFATFSPSFVLVDSSPDASMRVVPCADVGEGAYACNVTFNISGTDDTEFQGLNYTASTAFYWSGANPSVDWVLDENTSTPFQLWFQVTAASGALQPVIYLHMGEWSRS